MKDDWSVKEVIEPKSGKIHRLYSYKGKPAKRIVLDTPMAKQMAGYILIEKDLRSAAIWLQEIDRIRGDDVKLDLKGSRRAVDRERYNLVKGLFVAALTFYGKAFAQCEGRRVKLERRQIDAEFHEIHDDAIALRNNFAAHSGAKFVERSSVALVLHPKKEKIPPKLFKEMDQPDFFIQVPGQKTFTQLIEHAREIPLRKLKELDAKILKEDVIPLGFEYWAKK